MAVISVGLSCFDQFFFLNRWPEENTKISPAILLKAAADPVPMRHGYWDCG